MPALHPHDPAGQRELISRLRKQFSSLVPVRATEKDWREVVQSFSSRAKKASAFFSARLALAAFALEAPESLRVAAIDAMLSPQWVKLAERAAAHEEAKAQARAERRVAIGRPKAADLARSEPLSPSRTALEEAGGESPEEGGEERETEREAAFALRALSVFMAFEREDLASCFLSQAALRAEIHPLTLLAQTPEPQFGAPHPVSIAIHSERPGFWLDFLSCGLGPLRGRLLSHALFWATEAGQADALGCIIQSAGAEDARAAVLAAESASRIFRDGARPENIFGHFVSSLYRRVLSSPAGEPERAAAFAAFSECAELLGALNLPLARFFSENALPLDSCDALVAPAQQRRLVLSRRQCPFLGLAILGDRGLPLIRRFIRGQNLPDIVPGDGGAPWIFAFCLRLQSEQFRHRPGFSGSLPAFGQMLDFLSKKGADPNFEPAAESGASLSERQTSLAMACLSAQSDLALALLDCGADPRQATAVRVPQSADQFLSPAAKDAARSAGGALPKQFIGPLPLAFAIAAQANSARASASAATQALALVSRFIAEGFDPFAPIGVVAKDDPGGAEIGRSVALPPLFECGFGFLQPLAEQSALRAVFSAANAPTPLVHARTPATAPKRRL